MSRPYTISRAVASGTSPNRIIVVTLTTNHEFSNGDILRIWGLTGTLEKLNGTRTVTAVSGNTFTVAGISGLSNGSYTSIGTAALASSDITEQDVENTAVRRGLTPLPIPHITGMKLLEDVRLGSLVLNRLDTSNNAVWVCTDIKGWWTIPDSEFPKTTKAFGDGEYSASGRFVARQLTLEGSILCPDPSLAPEVRDELVEALNLVYSTAWLRAVERQEGTSPVAVVSKVAKTSQYATITTTANHGLVVGDIVKISDVSSAFNGTYVIAEKTNTTFSFYRDGTNVVETDSSGYVYLAEIVKASKVRLSGSPDIEVATARGRVNFSAGLIAVDPIKYYYTPDTGGTQSAILSILPEANGVTKLANAGNYSVGATFTVSGPVESPMIIKNNTNGQTITINSPLSGDEDFKIVRKEVFNNVTTLTLARAHGLSVGKTITVTQLQTELNGTYVISDIPDIASYENDPYGLKARKVSYELTSFGVTKSATEYTVGKSSSVTAASITSKVATLTTSTTHGFEIGQEVFVNLDDNTYDGVWTISDVPTTSSFKFKIDSANRSTSTTGLARVCGLIKVTTNEAHGFDVGSTVVVGGVGLDANTPGSEIIAKTSDTVTYYLSKTRMVATAAYYSTIKDDENDVYTIYTVGPHGFRVGDPIYTEGCGTAFNVSGETITAVNNVTNSVSFEKAALIRSISSVTYNKNTNEKSDNFGKYKVEVTTSSAHPFTDDMQINMVVTAKGKTTKPYGLNGVKTIVKTGSTTFYYWEQPAKETKEYLKEYFGGFSNDSVVSVDVVTTGTKYSFVTRADFARAISKGTITTTPTVYTVSLSPARGRVTVNSIEEQSVVTSSPNANLAVDKDVLEIDTASRSVYLNGSVAYARAKLDADIDWIKLTPGVNEIYVEDENDTSPTSEVEINFRSGWIA